eukprot:COSAG02_NODE_4057_length_5845_cov_8.300557_1_plen_118_part_00
MILHCLVFTDISECTGIDFGLLEITEVEEVEEIEMIWNRVCVLRVNFLFMGTMDLPLNVRVRVSVAECESAGRAAPAGLYNQRCPTARVKKCALLRCVSQIAASPMRTMSIGNPIDS